MTERQPASNASPLGALKSVDAARGVALRIGPFSVRIRSEHPEVARHVATLYRDYPSCAGPDFHFDVAVVHGRGRHRWFRQQAILSVNGIRPYHPLEKALAGPVLEWGLNHCIGQRTHHLVSCHAAVVEKHGKVLILSAESGAGKSTLCAALTYSGWRLFSDEFALVHPDDGLVVPAPRPISLKERAIAITRHRHPDVFMTDPKIDMDGTTFVHARAPRESVVRANEAAPARWIVLPKYVPGSRTSLEPLHKAQALMELVGHSFNYNHVDKGFDALAGLVDGCECFALEYSDLDDLLPRLNEMAAA